MGISVGREQASPDAAATVLEVDMERYSAAATTKRLNELAQMEVRSLMAVTPGNMSLPGVYLDEGQGAASYRGRMPKL
jgi:hypothetical protein